jgi:uncharacterized protein YkwD
LGEYPKAGDVAANIANGPFEDMTGYEFMLQFYIDDGVTSKGHRENIINPDFTHTGIAYC